MNEFEKQSLFISYSHQDKNEPIEFEKHLAPLVNNGLIVSWSDRNIISGKNFQNKIDKRLADADIICLLISSNFLSSDACMKEKSDAINLMTKKGISVIPIILSECGWKEDMDIRPLLALPTDAQPISSFNRSDTGWHDVYEGLKLVIQDNLTIRQLIISTKFKDFLQSTELLTHAHSRIEKVFLDDIYIYPRLKKYDHSKDYEQTISSEKLMNEMNFFPRMLIIGEDQSGKTSLCKKLFINLRQNNFVPVYISDKTNGYIGKIENKITSAFRGQYDNDEINLEDIDKERLVPIIDDFHFARHKEKLIQDLEPYPNQIIVVDDVFSFNIKEKNLTRSFQQFRIEEFLPSQRNELIKKWVQLVDPNFSSPQNEITIYQNIDQTTELVDSALGKSIGRGIMPAYPIFILMVINTYETLSTPLDQEITSQGHCYQALIFVYLKRENVKNDDMDTYMNFLTELAFHIYKRQKYELTDSEFFDFMKLYKETYNLPIKRNTLLLNIQKANIFSPDSFNNYSFNYQYLYFYFVAKYLADNIDEYENVISSVINNLHNRDNAYIAVFLSHHSKNSLILETTIEIASSLFEKYSPASLTRKELAFFDKQIKLIARAALPNADRMPEQARNEDLKIKDEVEQLDNDKEMENEGNDEFDSEIRRSFKTVEVMGTIIKNRAGSLAKSQLERVFEEGMKVHLRFLQRFLEILESEDNQQGIVDYISNRLAVVSRDRNKELDDTEELKEISKIFFWNLNFLTLCGVINKIIHSLGSDKLIEVIEKVCDRENTPAAFLVKHGILMWYKKNLRIDEIKEGIELGDFSEIAKNIIRHNIVDHCLFHPIKHDDRHKVVQHLGIKRNRLFPKLS